MSLRDRRDSLHLAAGFQRGKIRQERRGSPGLSSPHAEGSAGNRRSPQGTRARDLGAPPVAPSGAGNGKRKLHPGRKTCRNGFNRDGIEKRCRGTALQNLWSAATGRRFDCGKAVPGYRSPKKVALGSHRVGGLFPFRGPRGFSPKIPGGGSVGAVSAVMACLRPGVGKRCERTALQKGDQCGAGAQQLREYGVRRLVAALVVGNRCQGTALHRGEKFLWSQRRVSLRKESLRERGTGGLSRGIPAGGGELSLSIPMAEPGGGSLSTPMGFCFYGGPTAVGNGFLSPEPCSPRMGGMRGRGHSPAAHQSLSPWTGEG